MAEDPVLAGHAAYLPRLRRLGTLAVRRAEVIRQLAGQRVVGLAVADGDSLPPRARLFGRGRAGSQRDRLGGPLPAAATCMGYVLADLRADERRPITDIRTGWQAMVMRLRNPGGADAALATVRQAKDQLWNASVQGNNAADRKNAFLTWCDQWATPQLGNHFPASEDLFGELADSYYRVVQTPQLSERELNMLMARECKEWDARLERLIGEIQGRLAFLARPGRLVVLDTSALMEGVFFTDFDWHLLDPSLRGDAVRLVVPSLVVEELDDLKRDRDGRKKAKARRVLTALWDLHRTAPAKPAALPERVDVTIEVLLDDGWHRRMPNNDGEIIDQALSLRELTGQPVILAAGDYTQLYRAAPAGLAAILMPRPDEA